MSGSGLGKLVETAGNEDLRNSEIELDRAIEGLKGIAGTARAPAAPHTGVSAQSGTGALMNIPVEVHAVFGTAKMSIAELSALGPGSTILLDRNAGDPIDIIANGVHIATGEMVLLEDDGGRFGFRLVEILK
jgi:flagellar motor switch protein FliN